MRDLIVALTRMFHVVPSSLPDTDGLVLSVEVDGGHPHLADAVRALVAENDPEAAELHDQVDA